MIKSWFRKVLHPAYIIVLLSGLLGLTLSLSSLVYADTGGNSCSASGGATCKEIFAVNSAGHPLFDSFNGPRGTYMERTLRAYLYSGTKDNEAYAIFRMTITLYPNRDGRLAHLVKSSSDDSTTGDNASIHARLWSTNSRGDCRPFFDTCVQRNYAELEKQNFCQTNGGQQSFNIAKDLAQGVNIGWSFTEPTYSWCMNPVYADKWSRYYNYNLEDMSQYWNPITQDFVFAQWEDSGIHQFSVGFSARSKLFDPGPKITVDGPLTNDASAVFTY